MRIYKGMDRWVVTWIDPKGHVRVEWFKSLEAAKEYKESHNGN